MKTFHTETQSSFEGGEQLVVTPRPVVLLPDTLYRRRLKRVFDVVGASFAIFALMPVFAAVWLILRVKLGKGVVISQTRVGVNGENFEMLKFRTMHHSRRRSASGFNGPDRRRTHKSDSDPRHTGVGRAIRKASLDEIPQFFNVLRGEMSLVGPRPELAAVVDEHQLRWHVRHSVRPGVTGLWQVTSRNEGALLHESFDEDIDYLGLIRPSNDLAILIRTVGVVLGGTGR